MNAIICEELQGRVLRFTPRSAHPAVNEPVGARNGIDEAANIVAKVVL